VRYFVAFMRCGVTAMASEFDSMMAGMGIKPMQDDRGRSAPKKKVAPKATRKATRTSPAGKAAAPSVAGADTERVAELERGLVLAQDGRTSAEAKVAQLKKKVTRLQVALDESEERNRVPGRTAGSILVDWGFATADERAELLMVDGWLERIISTPNLKEAAALRVEISEKFVRVCADCHPPAGRTSLSIDRDRCEVCGGFDIDREARRFLDAALINGRLRVIVVGRESKHHRMVRDRVGDPRLVLSLIPALAKRETEQARTDVEHADAVVIWDPQSIRPELLEVYRGAPRVGEVPPGSIGAFLSAASAIIGSD
jgi:hypothetical protein